MHNKQEMKQRNISYCKSLWCNAAFGLHVCSTPYVPFVFVRDDV